MDDISAFQKNGVTKLTHTRVLHAQLLASLCFPLHIFSAVAGFVFQNGKRFLPLN